MTDDIAARLLAAIEETEQRFTVPLDVLRGDLIGQVAVRLAQWVQPPERAREVAAQIADRVMPLDATHITVDHEAVLRRCAADRKILTEILPQIERNDRTIERDWPITETSADDLLRAMAEGYGLTAVEVDDECE